MPRLLNKRKRNTAEFFSVEAYTLLGLRPNFSSRVHDVLGHKRGRSQCITSPFEWQLCIASCFLVVAASFTLGPSQTQEKMRLGYSGTGLNNYVLEMGRRGGIFRKNGLDLEVVYVNSGSLLNQALIAGTFDVSFSQGSEAMLAKLRGADMRIT